MEGGARGAEVRGGGGRRGWVEAERAGNNNTEVAEVAAFGRGETGATRKLGTTP